jgi:energy-coupling factor transporter ATP-binding protein EcfA2
VELEAFTAECGERIGLAGPNGSGKTSLLLGLAGLWPARGQLRLDGAPYGFQLGPAARRYIGVIQQDPSSQMLQPSVQDELAFGPRNLAWPEDRIRDRIGVLSDRLGLTAELHRDPSRLSAGRQQMVLLGAALAASPRLLLADEATAHMDVESRHRALSALKLETGQGLATVWASQNLEELAAMDRVLELGASCLGRDPSLHDSWPPDPGPARIRVHVSSMPSGSSDGPVVRVDHPLVFEVGQRGLTAVAGPNGAGKSVIMAAIAGLPSSQQVVVEWLEPQQAPPIAAFQFPELQIFQESVSDEITYASSSRGRPVAEALSLAGKWLERLGFAPETFLRQRTWALAMGARRLTEVIAALVAPASVVVLDEPTAGLDLFRRARLGDLLGELARARPIVIASQDREWLWAWKIPVTEIAPSESPKAP